MDIDESDVHLEHILASKPAIHGGFISLTEADFYPKHEKRASSSAYTHVHKELVVKEDLPCLVCGVKNSILKNPEEKKDASLNPYSASQMETHHHLVEWSLANAIDPKKFNRIIRPHLKRKHPQKS